MGVITEYHIAYLREEIRKEMNAKEGKRNFHPEIVDESSWDKEDMEVIREATLRDILDKLRDTVAVGPLVLHKEGFVDGAIEIFEGEVSNVFGYEVTLEDDLMDTITEHAQEYFESVFDKVRSKEAAEDAVFQKNNEDSYLDDLEEEIDGFEMLLEELVVPEHDIIDGKRKDIFVRSLLSDDNFSILWDKYLMESEPTSETADEDKLAAKAVLKEVLALVDKAEEVDFDDIRMLICQYVPVSSKTDEIERKLTKVAFMVYDEVRGLNDQEVEDRNQLEKFLSKISAAGLDAPGLKDNDLGDDLGDEGFGVKRW